eukprot:10964395-Lingulodinium_polyedra.AAC.1
MEVGNEPQAEGARARFKSCALGRRLTTFFLAEEQLLFDMRAWVGLPRCVHTQRYLSLAFALVSRTMCGVQQLVVDDLS